MSQQIVIKSNAAEYQRLVTRAMTLMRKNVTEMMLDEARLRFRDVMRKTPPNWGKSGNFAIGTSDLAVGRRAVTRDIHKVFRPIGNISKINDRRLRRQIRQRDYDGVRKRLAHVRRHADGMQVTPFDPFLYYARRNKRGRVLEGPTHVVLEVEELKRFIAKKRKRVGMARGGWVPTLKGLKGRFPQYAGKFSHWGDFSSKGLKVTTPSGSGYFTGANHSPWAQNHGEAERIVLNALNSRSEALRRKIAYMMRKQMQQSARKSPAVTRITK